MTDESKPKKRGGRRKPNHNWGAGGLPVSLPKPLPKPEDDGITRYKLSDEELAKYRAMKPPVKDNDVRITAPRSDPLMTRGGRRTDW